MEAISNCLYRCGFSQEDWEKISKHKKENFEPVVYGRTSVPRERLIGVFNRETGEIMHDDPECALRIKACCIACCWNLTHGCFRPCRILGLCRIEVLAIYGLYDPLKMREMIGLVERQLNNGKPYDKFSNFKGDIFYMQPCMQPLVEDLVNSPTHKRYDVS